MDAEAREEVYEPDDSGLGEGDRSDWPLVQSVDKAPIDLLRPGSEAHSRVLNYLVRRIEMSEEEMSRFYSRWSVNEKKYQCYIDLPNWEQKLKELNKAGEPPKAVNVIVPYSYATISTIVTYLIHAFCGRKPMFQVASYDKSSVQSSQQMEQVLQYNADHVRLVRVFHQFFQDAEIYNVGVMRTAWKDTRAQRTVWRTVPGMMGAPQSMKVKEERLVYSGNDVVNVDPYLFFPDPRVPMCEVNKKGEFVFWREFVGKHELKKAQFNGEIKYLEYVGNMPQNMYGVGASSRHLMSGGREFAALDIGMVTNKAKDYVQVDQGTVEIIPKELGLSDSERVEKWIFTIGNKKQILQAEPYDADHEMHPVAVAEPNTLGYGFGHAGTADYLGPLQDAMGWLVNSRMDNVRSVLNNMVIVDPSMIEMQDLKHPAPGKIIRLKSAAAGRDVRSVLSPLPLIDVTGGHMKDFELFFRMGDLLTAVNDNLRGVQDFGGRKTATEVRTSAEAGTSRLAAKARIISAQAIVDLTAQMSLNIQQNLDDEFYLSMVGQTGAAESVRISPEMLVGDFHYPIHDGTLPLDKVALLDAWKELLQAVAQDPVLRQSYSLTKIFEYIAELGGAKNIHQFRLQPQMMPDDQLQNMMNAGAAAPMGPVPMAMGAQNVPA